jgi:hypothetical protein
MENKIDLKKDIYYIQLDIQPVPALRVFERMDMGKDFDFLNEWPTKDYLKVANENELLLIVGDKAHNMSESKEERQEQLDILGIKVLDKDIPVYKMSDIKSHFQEIDKNSCACYILEPGKDKQALNKVGSLGYDRITSLTNDSFSLKKKDVILVIKNDAYIHPNPDDARFKETCPEMMDLLAPTGISNIKEIPRYKLDDFLEQEKKDIQFKDHFFLANIPFNRRTDAVCMSALTHHNLNIDDIPGYMFTDQRIGRILDAGHFFAEKMPLGPLNEGACLKAIQKDSLVFSFLPEQCKTENVCIAAYSQARRETDDPCYLESIIKNIPHSNVCMDLLREHAGSKEFYTILLSIPDKVFNQNIAELAVKLDENSIRDIPDKFISENMALTALKADAALIGTVPDRYKSFGMCENAIFTPSENKDLLSVFKAIPHPELVVEVLFSTMYEKVPVLHIAGSIPKEVMNQTVAELLVKQDADCLPHIPFHLKDENICLEAIKRAKTIDPLYTIPKDSMTDNVCKELISRFPQAIGSILPENKKSAEICFIAVEQDKTLERFVPDRVKNDGEMNIYRFARLVEKKIEDKLDMNQIKELYNGGIITVRNNLINKEKQNEKTNLLNVTYNKEKKTLDYSLRPESNRIKPNRYCVGINNKDYLKKGI